MKRIPLAVAAALALCVAAPLTRAAAPLVWPDPGPVIPMIDFRDAEVGDVAQYIQQASSNRVDVIVPDGAPHVKPGAPLVKVSLRMTNVSVAELFEAMNTYFEAGGAAVRWELSMNGPRRTAVLRPVNLRPAAATVVYERYVRYVGDLMGNKADGGLTLDEIAESIRGILNVALGANGYSAGFTLAAHAPTQMLIVRGTPDEIALVHQAVTSLHARQQGLRAGRKPAAAVAPVAPAKP